jgi:hypothetical protein
MVNIIRGDLLDDSNGITYIIQQSNCLTVSAHGLSQTIIDRYGKWADPYGGRRREGRRNLAVLSDRDTPGTFKLLRDPENDKSPVIVCLFAQYVPGIPGKYKTYPKWEIDTYQNRLKWFGSSLRAFIDSLKTSHEPGRILKLGFPYKIGCGLAGGKWSDYHQIIKDVEKEYHGVIQCDIYRLN